MTRIITALLAATILVASPVVLAGTEAGSKHLDINLASKHIDDCWGVPCENEYNEANFGLGLSYQAADNLELNVGAFKNSFNHTSTYFGGTINGVIHEGERFSIVPGLFLGGATGYQNTPVTDNDVVFVISPQISIDFGRFRVQSGFIPARNTPSFTFRVGFGF